MRSINITLNLDEAIASGGDIIVELRAAKGGPAAETKTDSHPSFFAFMEQVIGQLEANHQVRTTETYRSAQSSFKRYRNNQELNFDQLTPAVAADYERWLKQKGVVPNTSSFYMRILRAVYRRAVEQGYTTDRKPFEHVYTGNSRTPKRAIDVETLRRLESLKLDDTEECFARDMFMFSFSTQGMAFVDMAHLRKTDLHDGQLIYHRQKTGQRVVVAWTKKMQDIVSAHSPAHSSVYLLSIIDGEEVVPRRRGSERSRLRYCQYRVNVALAALSLRLGLKQHLTMYVARHSWASIAQSINVPIDVISRGMGHTSYDTTQIYLRDLDNGRQAAANQQVQSLLSTE